MENQFIRNIPSITQEEQMLLQSKRVLVAGCGGLGGYVIEYLIRLGVGRITAVDGDCFEPTNLNRQLYATDAALGKNKAEAAKARAAQIAPGSQVIAEARRLTPENAESILRNHDAVVDALDNVPDRLLLEDICQVLGITIIHGAVQGWTWQVATAEPGSGLLHRLYRHSSRTDKSALSFVPAACAAFQAAETVKLLLGRPTLQGGRLFYADMESAACMTLSV